MDPSGFLFASRPELMGAVPGIVYRVIATHLARQAGFSTKRARTGAVTLIQRFGGAFNRNPHFHILFLDGVDVEWPDGSLTFCWVKAPSGTELSALAGRIASRLGRESAARKGRYRADRGDGERGFQGQRRWRP
jgi:hypothetical protein